MLAFRTARFPNCFSADYLFTVLAYQAALLVSRRFLSFHYTAKNRQRRRLTQSSSNKFSIAGVRNSDFGGEKRDLEDDAFGGQECRNGH